MRSSLPLPHAWCTHIHTHIQYNTGVHREKPRHTSHTSDINDTPVILYMSIGKWFTHTIHTIFQCARLCPPGNCTLETAIFVCMSVCIWMNSQQHPRFVLVSVFRCFLNMLYMGYYWLRRRIISKRMTIANESVCAISIAKSQVVTTPFGLYNSLFNDHHLQSMEQRGSSVLYYSSDGNLIPYDFVILRSAANECVLYLEKGSVFNQYKFSLRFLASTAFLIVDKLNHIWHASEYCSTNQCRTWECFDASWRNTYVFLID